MTELGIELNDTSTELGIELDNLGADYNGLSNKPQINGTTLQGNKTGSQLGLANASDVYTKVEADTLLNAKADKSTTYTKSEADTLLNAKADKSTTYTKTETDTLLNAKVDKVNGKSLSTNDYTNEDKAKVQSAIQPNDNISELTNDAGYITSSYHDATKQDVISDLASIRQGASKGATSVQPSDISDMATKTWTNAQGFLKEHQSLANYYNKSETDAQISNHHDSSKQDTLVSGTNIKTINNQSVLGSGDIQVGGDVQSVNGKTGVVVLDAEDVGALPSTTAIPTKTSDLTNDGDGTNPFLTQHQSLSAYRTSANQDLIDATKVDKVTGKGLSENDYTNADKSLVGSALQPNDNVSELVNDAGYLTSHQSLANYYNKTETDTLLNAKQDNLPQVVNDKYLHTNASTGALEWVTVQGSVTALTTQEVDTIWEAN